MDRIMTAAAVKPAAATVTKADFQPAPQSRMIVPDLSEFSRGRLKPGVHADFCILIALCCSLESLVTGNAETAPAAPLPVSLRLGAACEIRLRVPPSLPPATKTLDNLNLNVLPT